MTSIYHNPQSKKTTQKILIQQYNDLSYRDYPLSMCSMDSGLAGVGVIAIVHAQLT